MNSYNLEIEKYILGKCISSKESLECIIDAGINQNDFFEKQHKQIYQGIIDAFLKFKNIDLELVTVTLKNINKSYLKNLVENSIKIFNLQSCINILMELSIKRQYENLANQIQSSKVEDIGSLLKEKIGFIETSNARIDNLNNIVTLDKIKMTSIYEAEKVRTGFRDIDNRILGIVTGSLVVITGYNGNGKSTLLNQMCIAESLSQGYKVFVYSPELTNSNFKSCVYSTIANSEDFDEDEFCGEKYKKLSDRGNMLIDQWIKDKLYIYSDSNSTSSEKQLLRDMDKLAKNKEVRVFIIDNLMKIDLEESYKNEYLAQKIFVNQLKQFATRYNALVYLVAHPKKPQERSKVISKFDIAGTGDITNMADYVFSISRITSKDRKKNSKYRDCIIKMMKDRPKGTEDFAVTLSFDKDRRRFYGSLLELDKKYGYIS